MIQAAQVIPEGPIWLAAASVALPSLLGAVKLGMSIVRPKQAEDRNGPGHEPVAAVEFRVDVRGRLDRLTEIAAKQAETSDRVGKVLERLDATLDRHEIRSAQTGQLITETARQVAAVYKLVVNDP